MYVAGLVRGACFMLCLRQGETIFLSLDYYYCRHRSDLFYGRLRPFGNEWCGFSNRDLTACFPVHMIQHYNSHQWDAINHKSRCLEVR